MPHGYRRPSQHPRIRQHIRGRLSRRPAPNDNRPFAHAAALLHPLVGSSHIEYCHALSNDSSPQLTGPSGRRAGPRLTHAEDDSHPSGNSFQRERIKTADDLPHVSDAYCLWPIHHRERHLPQTILRRGLHRHPEVRFGMRGCRECHDRGVGQPSERVGPQHHSRSCLIAGKADRNHGAALQPSWIYCHPAIYLNASASPAAASTSASVPREFGQFAARHIQAGAIIRVADIRDPDGRGTQAFGPLAITKPGSADARSP